MHLGFEAGDVTVAKVLAQLVDLLQLQEVDAQHLDRLHHLHEGTKLKSIFSPKISPYSRMKFISFPNAPQKKLIFLPKTHPKPIPLHICMLFPCPSITTPRSKRKKLTKFTIAFMGIAPRAPKKKYKPNPSLLKSVWLSSGGHFF